MKPSKNLIISIIVTALVAGGVGFGGGFFIGKAQPPSRGNFAQFGANVNRLGGAAANRLRSGGGMVNGEILSKDDKSITVKNRDGGSKIVFFAPSTAIAKTTDGTTDDLAVGKTVIVIGSANNDGSITANNIQIRPEGAAGFTSDPGGMMPQGTNGGPNNK
jgi:hypothetical protein